MIFTIKKAMQTNLKRMKQPKYVTLIGVLLMPLVFSLFVFDRLFTTALFWKDVPSMGKWMSNDKLMMIAFWRVVFVGIVYGLISFVKWIF